MLNSICLPLGQLIIPTYIGEIKMLPFTLKDLSNVPDIFKPIVEKMISSIPKLKGEAYLTVDGKLVEAGKSHRRGGPHIDGNYLAYATTGWGGKPQPTDWKTGGVDGRVMTSEEHALSYRLRTGGMLIASNEIGCKAWVGEFEGEATAGGDCSHLDLSKARPFYLTPNNVYYGNSHFIHESAPVDRDVLRTIVRITLPINYPWFKSLRTIN